MNVGQRIKEKRELLGMTQDELAEKTGYKSRSSINKIEKGGNDLPQSKIVLFAKILQTTPTYLMGWEEEWDKEVERLNQEFENNRKVLLKYLGTLFDDDKDKETAYELIINLPKLNHKGLEALNQRINELCRLEEYMNSIYNEINVKQVESTQQLPVPPIIQSKPPIQQQPVQPPVVQSSPQRQIQQPIQQPNLQRQIPVQQPVSTEPPPQSQIQIDPKNPWRFTARRTDGRYESRLATPEELEKLRLALEDSENGPKPEY